MVSFHVAVAAGTTGAGTDVFHAAKLDNVLSSRENLSVIATLQHMISNTRPMSGMRFWIPMPQKYQTFPEFFFAQTFAEWTQSGKSGSSLTVFNFQ
jgi:hypothetical protein